MKKQEVIDLASRRGLCVYEQYKGRKVYYKVRIPVFEDEKEIPTSYRDELVRNIKEVKQLMEKIWAAVAPATKCVDGQQVFLDFLR